MSNAPSIRDGLEEVAAAIKSAGYDYATVYLGPENSAWKGPSHQ